jgi:hypothetical protein
VQTSCWLPATGGNPQPDGEAPTAENAGAFTIANVDDNGVGARQKFE